MSPVMNNFIGLLDLCMESIFYFRDTEMLVMTTWAQFINGSHEAVT
jgi:hypothetical protein